MISMKMVDSTYTGVLIFALACFSMVNGGSYMIRKDHVLRGECKYTGYIPGGGKPNIKPITAPVATMPANALAKIAGLGSKSAALTMHSSNLMKSLSKGGEAFLKFAPKLAASLGIFGAALGFVAAFTKPTPQDILNQANKAIKELTKDVNDRMEKMKGYVDYRVIELEKNLMNKEYRTYFNMFSQCINEFSKEKVDECMRQANKETGAASPKFMTLDTTMSRYNPKIPASSMSRTYFENNPGKAPSFHDVKRIEVSLLSFKDYANLHLMILSTLVNTYKDDKTDAGKHYYGIYLNQLKSAAEKYSKYAKWAYKWITIRNYAEDINGKFKRHCDKPRKLKEGGWGGVHTNDVENCWVECTGIITKPRCDYTIYVRTDGKRPSSYSRIWINGASSYHSALTIYGKTYGTDMCNKYLKGLKHDITIFWEGELLNNVKVWDEIAEKAAKEIKQLPAGDYGYDDENEDEVYNEDFERRMNNAVQLTMEQNEELLGEDDDQREYKDVVEDERENEDNDEDEAEDEGKRQAEEDFDQHYDDE